MANTVTATQKRQINIRIHDLVSQFSNYEESDYYHKLGELTSMLYGSTPYDGLHFSTANVQETSKDTVTVFFFGDVDAARAIKMALQSSLNLIHQPHAMSVADQPSIKRFRIDDITRGAANAIVTANPMISHYEVKQPQIRASVSTGARRGRPAGSKNKPKTTNSIVTPGNVAVTAQSIQDKEISAEDIAEIAKITIAAPRKAKITTTLTLEEITADFVEEIDMEETYEQATLSPDFDTALDNLVERAKRVTAAKNNNNLIFTPEEVEEYAEKDDPFTNDEIADMVDSAPDHYGSMVDTEEIIEPGVNDYIEAEGILTFNNPLEDWELELIG